MRRRSSNHRPRPKRKHRRPPAGSAPGTLAVDPALPLPEIRLMAYGPDRAQETVLRTAEEAAAAIKGAEWPVVWLDVDGLGDAGALETIGAAAGLHRLSIADIASAYQRPKLEDFANYVLLIVRAPARGEAARPDCAGAGHDTEQVSLVLGPGFVITFQERGKPGDCFGGVRERIRGCVGAIRSKGPDHLAYALLDSVIDAYFPVLESLGDQLDEIEERAMTGLDPALLRRLHGIRRDYLTVRRAVWPLREAVGSLQRDPSPLVTEGTRVYLRDCYDHTVQLIDLVETGRELGTALTEMHLTIAGHRMNEIIKVLTIITTIFIPLSFIAGVYGMNFDPDAGPLSMPETRWRYGYPAVLIVMALIAAGMLVLFWRRGWLGGARARRARGGAPRA